MSTNKIKNHVNRSYELLQDLLLTTKRYKGLSFIKDFKIINHNKRHKTKPDEIVELIKNEIKKDWLIFDRVLKIEDFRMPKLKILSSLKSKKNIREARNNNVKVITRLDSNFVVRMFGNEFRKEDILDLVKPIRREMDGENYIIYVFKRCIWQKTAGNLFLIKGEEYDDFIPLFTTSLKSKPETIIRKYKERSFIEQTNKELKSLLDIEESYFCKKDSNYGYLFMVSLVYNIVQYLRLFFDDMSFKDALEELSLYLLYKNPPRCVFKMENKLNRVFGDIEFERSDKMDIGLMESTEVLGKVLS